jgi:CubicO group peptidase (beta-lactamase class C family)
MSLGEVEEKFEGLIADAMMRNHVPGLSLAIVMDGKVIYAKGFGARRLKDNAPATPNTLYGVGSCTKSFTALAIMQLVQQGKLNLKDPVKKHLPEFKLGKEENPITIHNLLTHSSGIPDLGGAEIEILRLVGVDEKWVPFSSFEDLMLHVNGAKDEVAAEPGSRFFYLNEGYELLGMIVERVSQMRYESYVRDRVLKPLKMNRSTFLREEFEKDQDVMTPYFIEKKDEVFMATPTVHPMSRLSYADGGLISSVRVSKLSYRKHEPWSLWRRQASRYFVDGRDAQTACAGELRRALWESVVRLRLAHGRRFLWTHANWSQRFHWSVERKPFVLARHEHRGCVCV